MSILRIIKSLNFDQLKLSKRAHQSIITSVIIHTLLIIFIPNKSAKFIIFIIMLNNAFIYINGYLRHKIESMEREYKDNFTISILSFLFKEVCKKNNIDTEKFTKEHKQEYENQIKKYKADKKC